MSDGPVFVEKVDYEAAWERYYVLADRRNKEGLTALQVRSIIDAALVGVRPAEGGQELTFFGPLIVPARYDPAYDVELPAGRYFVIRLDEEVE